VFAASVNESNFLQDDTGNSRFWVIPVCSINHAHTLDMQQVWAEFYVLWKGGEKHYLTETEMQMLNGHNETFTAPDPIFEMIHSHLDWDNFDSNNCRWMQVSDILRWIGKDNPSKFETILAGRAIQILNQGRARKSNGKKLSAVPNDKISIEVHNFDKISENFAERVDEHIPF
jgi:putative DNA primase/helicase